MYLWNTKALATKLRDGELTQAERFAYFFIGVVLSAFIMEVSFYIGKMPTAITITESIIAITITVVGTLLSYKINKAGDNKEFIDRYVCLSIPIIIKLIVLLIPLIGGYTIYMIVGYIALPDTFNKYIDSTSWIDALVLLLFELSFFWRLIHHIGWVSKAKTS